MNGKPRFEVNYLPEAEAFILELDEKTRRKVLYNITLASMTIDKELFKKIDDDIWEFRTLYAGQFIRLFAFWDKQKKAVVVATHGIFKKTKKTPKKEIERAKELMKSYLK